MLSVGTTLSATIIALARPEDLSCCSGAVLVDYLELASQPEDFIFHVDACSCWYACWGVGSPCRSRPCLFEMSYESYRDFATLPMDLSTSSFCLASSVLSASARRYPSRLCDMWLRHLASHLFYEGFATDPVFLITSLGYKRGTLDMLSEDAHVADAPSRDLRFVTISSITLWVIWKVRCSHILSVQPSSLTETLRAIWSVLLHTLRCQ